MIAYSCWNCFATNKKKKELVSYELNDIVEIPTL